ncbi:MAG: ATP-dependent DNA ligase [Planctomycetaceae bacterium]
MNDFTDLYWRLDATTSTNEKLAALRDFFAAAAPDDAACGLAVLCGGRQLRSVSSTQLREWAAAATGLSPWLVEECYAHVGDLAETLALLLPAQAPDAASAASPGLAEVMRTTIHDLRGADDDRKRDVVTTVWQRLAPRERIVWHKLLTGGLRVGVSRTLVARALAELAGVDPAVMAHRLMGDPVADGAAFTALLAPASSAADMRRPYPFFLASPLDRGAVDAVATALGPAAEWQAEWKWDGMRAQLVRRGNDITVWSRGEELVNEAFPEIVAAGRQLATGTVLDGELLAVRDGRLLGFTALSKRAGRRRVTKKILADIPCVFVAYDLLEADGVDLRDRPLVERRRQLEARVPHAFDAVLADAATADDGRLFLSPLVPGDSWPDLAARRAESRTRGVEGLMLKRRSSPYAVGRTKGDWWKWKIEPLEIDAVMLYAQAGHGRRAGLHSDYTLGVWHEGKLVTIAKAYSGLADAEIVEVDRIVRATTIEKHGPVRICTPTLVFQLAFEGVAHSTRHKSGVAVRFPRIVRWRRDKQPADAGSLADLERMIDATP